MKSFLIALIVFVLISQLYCASDFLWGAATSAYQIEGGYNQGGREFSIWDTFCRVSGKVRNNETGDVACDHYNRYKEDVALMKKLKINSYRFSISWSRLLKSSGEVNPEGMRFYNNLINELVANQITPFVTLYHWDLPQSLDQPRLPGWLSTRIIPAFVHYADTCFRLFGDRVKHWLTFNEPWVTCWDGYGSGYNAPGRCSNRSFCKVGNSSIETYVTGHNLLLAHAEAVKLYRTKYQRIQNGKIGITFNSDAAFPRTQKPEDVEATERHMEFFLGWFADPVFLGDYPKSMKKYLGDRLPKFTEEQKKLLKGSADIFGINHYTSRYITNGKEPGEGWIADKHTIAHETDVNGNMIGIRYAPKWLISVPRGMRALLKWIANRYNNPPIYITENGVGSYDEGTVEEQLNDQFRVEYYKSYVDEMLKAKEEGVNVKGYFSWSMLDNFEWTEGYYVRFGLHFIDYKNGLKRYRKKSAEWWTNMLSNRN
jgi:beta-glucosidase